MPRNEFRVLAGHLVPASDICHDYCVIMELATSFSQLRHPTSVKYHKCRQAIKKTLATILLVSSMPGFKQKKLQVPWLMFYARETSAYLRLHMFRRASRDNACSTETMSLSFAANCSERATHAMLHGRIFESCL